MPPILAGIWLHSSNSTLNLVFGVIVVVLGIARFVHWWRKNSSGD